MRRKLCFAALFVITSCTSVVAVDLARLESAFLSRQTVTSEWKSSASVYDHPVARLQSHFDVVLQILNAQTAESLNRAMDRLKQHHGALSPHEEAVWRHQLIHARAANIRHLEAYARRGRFPLNENHASTNVPIFVDNHDTACAVGFLMRKSGWGAAVTGIAATNNLVYVSDVTKGPLVDWILHSGLTGEEAALIQPAYPPRPEAFLDDLLNGSITRFGLRYDNFSYSAIGSGMAGDAEEIGLSWHHGWYPHFNLSATDAMYFGHTELIGGFGHTENANEELTLFFNYDVTAVDPSRSIDAAWTTSVGDINLNSVVSPGEIAVQTTIRSALGDVLAVHEMTTDGNSYFWWSSTDLAEFFPQNSLQISMQVDLMDDEALFTSITHAFRVVPEPTAWLVSLIGLTALLFRSRPAHYRTSRSRSSRPRFKKLGEA